jgi:hypothetical protein
MNETMVGTARLVRIASALALASSLFAATAVAQTNSVDGDFGSNDGRGSAGISLGPDSASGGTTVGGPSGTTGSGSLRMGQGSGLLSSSAPAIGNTQNFSSAFAADQFTGSLATGPGDTTATIGSISGIAAAIRGLTIQEQRVLAKKCVAVLMAPMRHEPDEVVVCKVLASL